MQPWAWLILIASFSSCSAGRYSELLPEDVHPRYAERSKRIAEWNEQYTTVRVPTRDPASGGARFALAVHRPRELKASRVCILLHGALSDHRTFRYLQQELQSEVDVVLIDLPGCGESGGWPAYRGVCAGYTMRETAHRIMQAIGSLESDLPEATRVLLVGHSYGGAVALHCLAMAPELAGEAGEVSQRIDGLALISPYDPTSGYRVKELEYIARVTAFEVLVAVWSGFLKEGVSESVWESAVEPGSMPREEADRMIEILSRGSLRRAAQAMLLRAAPWDANGELDTERASALAAEFAAIDQPCLVLWGAEDDTLPIALGEDLCKKLAQAELRALPNCKHSPQLEHFEACAEAILEFADSLAKPPASEPILH